MRQPSALVKVGLVDISSAKQFAFVKGLFLSVFMKALSSTLYSLRCLAALDEL